MNNDKLNEFRKYVDQILSKSMNGQDACENIDAVYHCLCDIEEICLKLKGELNA